MLESDLEMEEVEFSEELEQGDSAISVAETGRLTDAFVKRFRDEAIPRQRQREMRIAALIADRDNQGLIAFAAEAELAAYQRYHALDQKRKRKCEAHAARLAEYETMVTEAELIGMEYEELRSEHELAIADFEETRWPDTIRLAGAAGALLMEKDRSKALRAELRELVSTYPLWVADPYPGTGKTRAIGQILLASTSHHIIHASPINRLSWEIQDRHFGDGVRVLTGWSGSDADGVRLCRRYEQGVRVEALGGRWSTMCKHFDEVSRSEKKCAHYDACPAQKMMQNLEEATHIALTQNHLLRPLPVRVSEDLGWTADAVTIDEVISNKIFAGHHEILTSDLNLDFCTSEHNHFADKEEAAAAIKELRLALVTSNLDQGVWFSEMYALPKKGLRLAKGIVLSTLERRAERKFVDADDHELALYELQDAMFPSSRLRQLGHLIDLVLSVRHDDAGRMGRLVITKNNEQKRVILVAIVQRLNSEAVGGKAILHASAFPEPDEILSETFSYFRTMDVSKVKYTDDQATINKVRRYYEVRPEITRMEPMKVTKGKNVSVTQYLNAGAYIGRLGLRGDCKAIVKVSGLERMSIERSWVEKTLKERARELKKRLRLAEFIKRETEHNAKVVLVAVAAFRDWLKLWFAENGGWPEGLALLPWGLAVGQNQFEDFDCLIVVGNRIIPKAAQHLRACAISGHWEDWPSDGQGPDRYSAWMLFNEVGQAIERIRTRHDKSKPVSVHVFSDLEVPMDAEQVDARKVFNDMELEALGLTDRHEHSLESIYIGNVCVAAGDCLPLSVRDISLHEGRSNTAARALAKERSLPGALDGYQLVSVSFLDKDGQLTRAPYQRYAVREGLDVQMTIEHYTSRKVYHVKAGKE